MTKSEAISRVELLLGGEVLKLEISQEKLGVLLDMAYDKIKPYLTDTKMITKGFSQVIDLSEENIEDVLRVYPADSTILTQDKMFDFEGIKLDRTSIKRAILGSYPIIDSEIHFKYYDKKLYLEYDKVYSGVVTIEGLYTPRFEDLKDERAVNWIVAYTLALAKEVCGRIRSKFKSPNIPVEFDGDTLLQEAQSEKQALELEIQERQFGPFMILR